MEINNTKNVSLLDFLKPSSNETTSNTTNSFQEFFLNSSSESTTSISNYQNDSQKHYLKDKVSDFKDNFKEKLEKNSDKTNSLEEKISSSDVVEEKSSDILEKVNDAVEDKIESKDDKTVDTENVKTDELDDKKLEKLAEILNVSVENLEKTLDELNLTIDSLTNSENAKDLLVALNSLESKVDLLSLDNLKEQLKGIDDLASGKLDDELDQSIVDDLVNQAIAEIDGEELAQNATEDENNSSQSNTQSNATQNTNVDAVEVLDIEVSTEESVESSNITSATEDVLDEATVANGTVNNTQATTSQTLNTVNTEFSDMNINSNVKVGTDNSFVSQVAKSLGSSNVDTENVLKQITDAMKVDIKGDIANEVKITLRPAHLGDVTLKIVTENGIITAQFEAESQRVKEIIESNFNQLKDSLKQQGIEISNLQVNVNENKQNSGTNNQSDNSRNRNSNTYGNVDGISEEEIVSEVIVDESIALGSRNTYRA